MIKSFLEPFLKRVRCVCSIVYANLASVFKCAEVSFLKDILAACSGEIKGV